MAPVRNVLRYYQQIAIYFIYLFITLYHWNTYIIKNKHQKGIFTKHQNILHTPSIKFCTSEWQGLTGASTSRTVPPITKISLRGQWRNSYGLRVDKPAGTLA